MEQLWCNGLNPAHVDEVTPDNVEATKLMLKDKWKHLKVLVCEGGQTGALGRIDMNNFMRLVSIDRGSRLHYLELRCFWDDIEGRTFLEQTEIWPSSSGSIEGNNSFKNLRHLRLNKVAMDGTSARDVLQLPFENGKLQSFDINFRTLRLDEPVEGSASSQHMRDFAWLRGCESIRSLSLLNFRFRRHPRSDEDMPLPSFLASFPNLEDLQIESEYYDDPELCSVIVEVLKVTHLKTLYQSTMKGMSLDHLREATKQFGVQLVQGGRPRPWPIVLEE